MKGRFGHRDDAVNQVEAATVAEFFLKFGERSFDRRDFQTRLRERGDDSRRGHLSFGDRGIFEFELGEVFRGLRRRRGEQHAGEDRFIFQRFDFFGVGVTFGGKRAVGDEVARIRIAFEDRFFQDRLAIDRVGQGPVQASAPEGGIAAVDGDQVH